jgi:hypothetical protein
MLKANAVGGQQRQRKNDISTCRPKRGVAAEKNYLSMCEPKRGRVAEKKIT